MEQSYDIETILQLLSFAKMESIQLRKLTTTSFRVELVFSFNDGARMKDEHMANLREYAQDFGVTIEQAEEELRRE